MSLTSPRLTLLRLHKVIASTMAESEWRFSGHAVLSGPHCISEPEGVEIAGSMITRAAQRKLDVGELPEWLRKRC